MYRPTVRYDDVFKNYVDELYKSTRLDRAQIFRLAFFAAAHSSEFRNILEKHLNRARGVTSVPYPVWGLDEEEYWKNQNYIPKQKLEEPTVIKVFNQGEVRHVFK